MSTNVTKLSRSNKAQPPLASSSPIPTVWDLSSGVAPVEAVINGMVFYEFSHLDSQEMHTEVTIPSNYVAGSMVNLISGMFFTSAVVGNVLFRAQVSLIRPSVTVEGTYPDSYVSTNAQIPVSVVANQFTEISSIDITSMFGAVGVAIQANDRLRVTFYRDIASEAPSAVASAFLLKKSFVVKFS
jgi:hypothetical protein